MRVLAGIALFVLILTASGGAGTTREEKPGPGVPAVHGEGALLENAVVEVLLGCLRENPAAAIAGMEKIEGNCRRLSPSESAPLPLGVLTYDQALHMALAKSREFAEAGQITGAFDQFVWVMRACRQCHEMVRRAGSESGAKRPPGS